jgi:hypothetical protein
VEKKGWTKSETESTNEVKMRCNERLNANAATVSGYFSHSCYRQLRSWCSGCPMHHHGRSSIPYVLRLALISRNSSGTILCLKILLIRFKFNLYLQSTTHLEATMAHIHSTVASSDRDLSPELATLMATAVFLGSYDTYLYTDLHS